MGKASDLFGMDFSFKPEALKKPVEGSRTAEQLFGKGLAYEEEEISSEGVFEGYNDYLKTTEMIESGGRADAKAPTSSATGLHQFTESTWKGLVEEMGLDYSLEDRTNPSKSKIVMERFTKKNYDYLQSSLGREPESHELYMAHFLGRTGAAKFLSLPHDTPVSKAVTRSQFRANPGVFKDKKTGEEKTVGEVLSTFKSKYDEST